MDQSILNSIFKIWSDGLKHSSDGPWLVAMGIDYYLSIAMGIEEEAIKKEEATGSCS
jgi:hypothetical protein